MRVWEPNAARDYFLSVSGFRSPQPQTLLRVAGWSLKLEPDLGAIFGPSWRHVFSQAEPDLAYTAGRVVGFGLRGSVAYGF